MQIVDSFSQQGSKLLLFNNSWQKQELDFELVLLNVYFVFQLVVIEIVFGTTCFIEVVVEVIDYINEVFTFNEVDYIGVNKQWLLQVGVQDDVFAYFLVEKVQYQLVLYVFKRNILFLQALVKIQELKKKHSKSLIFRDFLHFLKNQFEELL